VIKIIQPENGTNLKSSKSFRYSKPFGRIFRLITSEEGRRGQAGKIL
jgi:hypothetical protein